MANHLQIQHLFYTYSGDKPLFSDLNLSFPPGWTALIGANGIGKTSLLRLIYGELTPDKGQILSPHSIYYCPQRVDEPPDQVEALFDSQSGLSGRLRGELGIESGWLALWERLSCGEKKRIQIGVALLREPEVLLLDEPTNHLDLKTKKLLLRSLANHHGIGLLVSHDRSLIQLLCRKVVLLQDPLIFAPDLKQAMAEHDLQRSRDLVELEQANKELKRLKRRAGDYREKANRANSLRSKKKLGKKDHDAKAKIDLARVSGKDGQAGRRLNQLQGRIELAQKQTEAQSPKPDYKAGVKISSRPAKQDYLLHLPQGSLELPHAQIHHPDLSIFPNSRIALVGPNGAGKSSLLKVLIPQIKLAQDRYLYLPQEFSLLQTKKRWAGFLSADPEQKGRTLALFARLGSDSKMLLHSSQPSPGELRKLIIADALDQEPALLLLDEPTNHLDLFSLFALEKALEAFQAALFLISHDLVFLRELCDQAWHIKEARNGLTLKVENWSKTVGDQDHGKRCRSPLARV